MNNTVKARFSVLVIVALILVPWSQIEYEFEAEGYCITGGKRFEVTQFYPIRFVIGRKLSTIRFIMHQLELDTTAEDRLIEYLCT